MGKSGLVSRKSECVLADSVRGLHGCRGSFRRRLERFIWVETPWDMKLPFLCEPHATPTSWCHCSSGRDVPFVWGRARGERRTASVGDSGSFQKETRGQQLFPRKTFHLQVLGEGKSLLLDQRQEADQTSSSFAPLIQVKPAFCSPFPSPSFFILFHNGMFKKKK